MLSIVYTIGKAPILPVRSRRIVYMQGIGALLGLALGESAPLRTRLRRPGILSILYTIGALCIRLVRILYTIGIPPLRTRLRRPGVYTSGARPTGTYTSGVRPILPVILLRIV